MDATVEPLFQIEIECMCCGHVYRTSRVRPSFRKSMGTDTDFYMRYKQINPDYYVVRVCPSCGFAVTENFSPKLSPVQKQLFEEKVRANWKPKDYGGERTWSDALETYKLALLTAQIKEESDRIVASLLHHIAWLYREKGDWEQEKRFLAHALDEYIKVYELEGVDVNNARLMYLIGELHRRLGHYREAVKWFSRVVNDKKIMDAAMIRASREQWARTREEMLAAQMEVQDEELPS